MSTAADPLEFYYRRSSDLPFFEVFHAHRQMEFTYVHEGTGNLIIEGKQYSIEPNTLMIFQPFQLHRVQMDTAPGLPFIRTVIMFDPAILMPYWRSFPILERFFQEVHKRTDGRPLYEIRESEPIIAIMKHFNDAQAKLSAHEMKEENDFFLLDFMRQLKQLWKKPDYHVSSLSRRHHHRAEEIMQWIELHHPEAFQLHQLANDLHLSPYHVAHLFKQATGSTIVDYTKATRIRHACVYLIQTMLTVPEIGVRVGIPNPSYFCKVFRAHMGSTPHQYRLHIQKR
ncbi:AraC family transcriptional regulator [Cohnella sp.]|uniref:AraC family transcriptional regulator n=1 Tax=Cohnella sp. TaxID=1883426 RepID=UPI00356B34CD